MPLIYLAMIGLMKAGTTALYRVLLWIFLVREELCYIHNK